jgi:hypothetical protein
MQDLDGQKRTLTLNSGSFLFLLSVLVSSVSDRENKIGKLRLLQWISLFNDL